MKIIIIYYSYGGNTRSVAKLIQKNSGYDIAEIQTVMPYAADYNKVVEQGEKEVNAGYMPSICPLSSNLSDYDTIILGTPVWWYTVAPAVKTFLTRTDLSSKTIYPFVTHGGWPGSAMQDITALCKGAKVKQGLEIYFDADVRKANKRIILSWADIQQGVRK